MEQNTSDRTVNRRDMLRNPGLGGVFPLRRAGEGAFFTDGNDGADLPQGDIRHDCLNNRGIRKPDDPAQNILFLL